MSGLPASMKSVLEHRRNQSPGCALVHWRQAFERLGCWLMKKRVPEEAELVTDRDLVRAIRCGVSDAFSDGINSGFYINSYTTKPGPGLAGMLEELRKGRAC